jgi:hypothetical protein
MSGIRYRDGQIVLVGDVVEIDPNTTGTIVAVVYDLDWVMDQNDQIGIYVSTLSLGLVRISPEDDGLKLLNREKAKK